MADSLFVHALRLSTIGRRAFLSLVHVNETIYLQTLPPHRLSLGLHIKKRLKLYLLPRS